MKITPRITSLLPHWLMPVAVLLFSIFAMMLLANTVWAADGKNENLKAGERLITIHDRDKEKSLISSKTTLREVFKEEGIITDPNDIVEPGLDEDLPGNNYQVNIYRARPITVVDGGKHIPIMSAYQTPRDIAKHAGLKLHDEDEVVMGLTNNVVGEGMGLKLVIERATPVKLVLYGNESTVYTMADTVGALLREKKVTLGKKDTLSVKPEKAITKNMKIQIWRNGKQVITKTESVDFDEKQIQDADRKVGYRKVQTPGVKGKKKVTYEIIMRNGKEVKRKVIQEIVTKQPKEQVVIVGSKPSFDGDFADALAKLRSCESGGNYQINTGNGYYGAYQFSAGSWQAWAPSEYKNVTADNAPPAAQDQAVRNYYVSSGWGPWPKCSRDLGLPDIYR